MIENKEINKTFEKYPEYKDSGVEWLGEIPEGWGVKRIKHLYNIGRGRVIAQTELIDDGPFPVYSSQTKDDGILGYINTYDYDCEQITWTTDGANAGTIFIRKGKHNCTNVCGTLQPNSKSIINKFNKYALEVSSPHYKRPDTNGAKIMNNEMAEIFIVQPTFDEQTAIANFLDNKTSKIDTAIAQKEQMIALLKERKQIIIQNAVTGKWSMVNGQWSMTPKEKMKDSGVEWIGEIPEHWEVKKIKHVTRKTGSGVTPSGGGTTYLDEGGVPLLRSQNIHFGRIDLTNVARISQNVHDTMNNSKVEKGDVLLNITGGSIGRCHFVETDKPLNVNQHVCIVRPNKMIETRFLNNLLASNIGQDQIWFYQQGGGREGLNFQALNNFVIPFPPKQERMNIIEFIEKENNKINQAISLQQSQIEKLKEYKATLIDGAVTGKIMVNG